MGFSSTASDLRRDTLDREFFGTSIDTLRQLSDAEVTLPGCVSDPRQSKSAIEDSRQCVLTCCACYDVALHSHPVLLLAMTVGSGTMS